MKKYFLIGMAAVSLSLIGISCTSTSFVPGEDKVRLQNISSEYFFIAKSYEDLKNYSKAIEYYKLARTNDEIKNACDYGAAKCYAYLKDWDNALAMYNRLLEQDSKNLNLRLTVAYINAVSGNLEEGISMYEALLQDGVDGAGVYKNYVSLLVAVEKYEEANAVLTRMEEQYPESDSIDTLRKKIDAAMNPPEQNQ